MVNLRGWSASRFLGRIGSLHGPRYYAVYHAEDHRAGVSAERLLSAYWGGRCYSLYDQHRLAAYTVVPVYWQGADVLRVDHVVLPMMFLVREMANLRLFII